MCSRISRIIMGMTTWMKKCVVFVQIGIKCVSMKENVVEFVLKKECVGTPQRLLGFAAALNMWDLARCLEPDSLHCHLQPIPMISFGFVIISLLDHQAHIF